MDHLLATAGQALTRTETATLGKRNQFVTGVAFSPDSRLLVFGVDDGVVEFWDVGKGKSRGSLRAHRTSVEALAFSSDGRYLATGGRDKLVRVWDLSSGVAKAVGKPLEGHKDAVIALAFSPDAKLLATGSQDRTIRVWNIQSGGLLQTFTGHSGYVSSLAFHPQGTMLASGSRDGTVRVWDVSSIGQVGRLAERADNLAKTAVFDQNGETTDSSVSALMSDVIQLGIPRFSPEQCKQYLPAEQCPAIARTPN